MTPGEQLEEDAANAFADIGLEPTLTKASGQCHGNGDVLGGQFLMAECKYKATEGFSVSKKDYDKAMQQASQQRRDMVFFARNTHGQTLVSMSLQDWVRWMSPAIRSLEE
jgi:hypothetical protein